MSSDSIDEVRRRQFEQARRTNRATPIADHLPPEGSESYLPTLEELVLIDLEFGWKEAERNHAPGPRVETYLEAFPRLAERDVVLRLLRYEYELRCGSGPTPSVSEYRERFPAWVVTGREVVAGSETRGPVVTNANEPHRGSDVVLAGNEHVVVATTEAGHSSARYSLTRLHAEGGLGRIWVARDGSLERDVALKELKPHTATDANAWRRFLREAQVTGQLEHPNIVPVYELSQTGPEAAPFYTMRLVKGKTLREAIGEYHDRRRARHDDPLALPRLLQAFVNVCQAVSYAHSRGVIHRDLKPDNIILGDFGEVLVLDWGLAKTRRGDDAAAVPASPATEGKATATMAAELTALGSVVGTPAYMAPEQAAAQAEAVDERTDVFGLGGILFEILTGRPPRTGSDVRAMLGRAVDQPVMNPRQVLAEVPPALDAICARALALKPTDRYAAAVDVAQDVQRFLADEPTTAYRESWARRSARWRRKHRTLVAVAAAVGLVSAAAIIFGLFVRQRIENDNLRREAEAVAALYSRVAVDTALADEEIRAGRFGTAAELLERSSRQLAEASQLGEVHSRLASRHDRARKLDGFYRGIDRGEQLEFFEYDDQAEAEIRDALKTIGAMDAEQWWNALPVDDLSPQQVERLREDVFRQLLLLGSIRAKSALVDFGAKDSAEIYREVLRISQKAAAWRPSQSARVLEVFARVGLGPLEALKLGLGPAIEPTSQADLYFVGLMQFWFGQQQDAVSKLLNVLRPFTGMDFTDSLAASERHLRTAVARDPTHYWTWFFLGWTKMQSRDYAAAEMAFDTCVALRPESAIGYSYRGLTILLGARHAAEQTKNAVKPNEKPDADDKPRQPAAKPRPEEVARSLADLAKSEELDPTNSEIVYLRARGVVLADKPEEGKAALLRWIDLEPPLTAWKGQRIAVEKRAKIVDLLSYVAVKTKEKESDLVAWALWAEGAARLDDTTAAARAVDMLLKANPDDVRGLTVRADLALRRNDVATAIGDLERASASDPKNWSALMLRSQARLKQGSPEAGLRDAEAAFAAAKTDWQRAAARLRKVEALAKLSRTVEADETFAEAKRFDRRAADPRLAPPKP